MENSIRQIRKAKRANQIDKFGFSKALSRKQRRSARRLMFSQCYTPTTGGVIRLAAGTSVIKDNRGSADHYIYGGGSARAY